MDKGIEALDKNEQKKIPKITYRSKMYQKGGGWVSTVHRDGLY